MKRYIIKYICVVLCIAMLGACLVQCAKKQEEIKKPDGPTYTEELVDNLGMCVTELKVYNLTPEALAKRYKDYTDMGFKYIRLETGWVSFSPGQWSLAGDSQTIIKAAIDAGMRLKLVCPTISQPQSRITNDPKSLMRNYNGVNAVATLSYWYDGLYEYTEDAINCQLLKLDELGFLEYMDALVVDFGPAAEPLYPAPWTQTGTLENTGLTGPSMWCYDENAVADFKADMLKKYGSVEKINEAWGTTLTSMDEYKMPATGEVTGQQWEDVLTWYLQSKREFIEKQIQIFKAAVDKHTGGRVQLILYMPGASFSQDDWNHAVQTGSADFSIAIGSENEFIADMAEKYDCLLQYTGLPYTPPLEQVQAYMQTKGIDIPIFGENYADEASAGDTEYLFGNIKDYNLAGLDYTFTRFLCEDDGVTLSEIGKRLQITMPKIVNHLKSTPILVPKETTG